MKSEEILLLTPKDVRSLLSLNECIVAVEQAFRLYGEGKALPPGFWVCTREAAGFTLKLRFKSLAEIILPRK
jgi:hypothetical protein